MADLPDDLIQLQRAAHAAWDDVEAHRKQVDAERRAAPRVVVIEGQEPMLRPWTPEEDAEHQRLMQAARQAQQDLRAAVDAEEELGHGIEVVQGLHCAARVEA